MVKALSEAVSHRRAFEEFDKHLKEDKADQVAKWEDEYAAWDKKPTGSPCIFDTRDSSTLYSFYFRYLTNLNVAHSMASLKLKLADEEAARAGLASAPPYKKRICLTYSRHRRFTVSTYFSIYYPRARGDAVEAHEAVLVLALLLVYDAEAEEKNRLY